MQPKRYTRIIDRLSKSYDERSTRSTYMKCNQRTILNALAAGQRLWCSHQSKRKSLALLRLILAHNTSQRPSIRSHVQLLRTINPRASPCSPQPRRGGRPGWPSCVWVQATLGVTCAKDSGRLPLVAAMTTKRTQNPVVCPGHSRPIVEVNFRCGGALRATGLVRDQPLRRANAEVAATWLEDQHRGVCGKEDLRAVEASFRFLWQFLWAASF